MRYDKLFFDVKLHKIEQTRQFKEREKHDLFLLLLIKNLLSSIGEERAEENEP